MMIAIVTSSDVEILSCPQIKSSIIISMFFDGVKNGALMSNFTPGLSRVNTIVPNTFFAFPEAADFSPTPVLKQNAEADGRKNWVNSKS